MTSYSKKIKKSSKPLHIILTWNLRIGKTYHKIIWNKSQSPTFLNHKLWINILKNQYLILMAQQYILHLQSH